MRANFQKKKKYTKLFRSVVICDFFFQVGKSHSVLYHSACIWGVEMYPDVDTHESLPVPAGSFITCSSDDTIRVWNLNPMSNNNATIYRRNIYSNVSIFFYYFTRLKKTFQKVK